MGCRPVNVMVDLPQYLTLPSPTAEVFGTLRKRDQGTAKVWEIEADPQVIVLAKRLFPGAEGRGAGRAKFPANKRSFADLVWFLQRYPLAVENPDEFRLDYEETCSYVRKRQDILLNPVNRLPDTLFKGELRPYQQEGLDWALTNRRTLIADGMGLGKTVGGLAFLSTEQTWPALIVPPPHLVRHWEQFIFRFLDVGSSAEGALFTQGKPLVHVIRGTKEKTLPDAHIYIIHYLLLRAWRTALREKGIRRIIFDEIQELRHSGTEKYSNPFGRERRMSALSRFAQRPVLTGCRNMRGWWSLPNWTGRQRFMRRPKIERTAMVRSFRSYATTWCRMQALILM